MCVYDIGGKFVMWFTQGFMGELNQEATEADAAIE